MYGVTVHSCGSPAFTDVATDCFSYCVNLFNCTGISENGYSDLRDDNFVCADTLNGGFNDTRNV